MNTEVQIMMLNTQSGENLLAVKIPKFLKEKVEILDGRRWDPVNLYWKVPIHHLPKLELSFPQAVFSPGVIQYKENQTLRQLHLEKEFLELTNGVDLRQPLLNGKTLFDYQRTGVLLLLRNKRMILVINRSSLKLQKAGGSHYFSYHIFVKYYFLLIDSNM